MEPQRLASLRTGISREGDELDPARAESFDVQHVETLVEPVDEEGVGLSAVGPDGSLFPLVDERWIDGEGEEAKGGLRERLGQRAAGTDDASAAGDVEVGEAWCQEPPPPRSP